MRMFLAICLAFVFVLAHPGVPTGPALARQAEAAAVTTSAGTDVHAHDEGHLVLTDDGHSCCPGMAAGAVSQGKASHCSLDGGFIASHPAGLASRGACFQVPPAALRLQAAEPGAILHPPMPA